MMTPTPLPPSYTPFPTNVPTTPLPSLTPDPKTPTPVEDPILYSLLMPNTFLEGGDHFLLTRDCVNRGPQSLMVGEYIILDVSGAYWFWPEWTQELKYVSWLLDIDHPYHEDILNFIWPEGVGEIRDVGFWGALVHPASQDLIIYGFLSWGAH